MYTILKKNPLITKGVYLTFISLIPFVHSHLELSKLFQPTSLGRLFLILSLYSGFLVICPFLPLPKNTIPFTLPLKSLQCTIDTLTFFNPYHCQTVSPPLHYTGIYSSISRRNSPMLNLKIHSIYKRPKINFCSICAKTNLSIMLNR